MVFEHDPCIAQYEHLRSLSRETEALHMLRKIASIVKPIMRLRGWRVGVLGEFCPTERNLLGMNWNRGQKICLRLRHVNDERQFLPVEDLVDTMLHELCHIVHGPHDEPFHNLWNKLRDENEDLIRKGYTGEGFLSVGHKLGGRAIPKDEARRLARAAAQKRTMNLDYGAGRKLGGTSVRRGQDIRQIIADAASRRTRVTEGCTAEGTSLKRRQEIVDLTGRNSTRTFAENEDPAEQAFVDAYIDLIQDEERDTYGLRHVKASLEFPAGSRKIPMHTGAESSIDALTGTSPSSFAAVQEPIGDRPDKNRVRYPVSKPNASRNTSRQRFRPRRPPSTAVSATSSSLSKPWTCNICTLVNPCNYLVCDACNFERPSPNPTPNTDNAAKSTATPSAPKPHAVKGSRAIASLMRLDKTIAAQPTKPAGWICFRCTNWMEQQWWTCSRCGTMKASS